MLLSKFFKNFVTIVSSYVFNYMKYCTLFGNCACHLENVNFHLNFVNFIETSVKFATDIRKFSIDIIKTSIEFKTF